jgi:hypothetical protein
MPARTTFGIWDEPFTEATTLERWPGRARVVRSALSSGALVECSGTTASSSKLSTTGIVGDYASAK